MLIKANIALAAAAIILGSVTMASAATKHVRNSMVPGGLYDRAVPYSGSLGGTDSPASTGGGSIGYNQNIYNW